MIVHKIHDLSNAGVISILKSGLSRITDEKIIINYHPDYRNNPANLFNILESGNRFSQGNGAYYVVEQNGLLISCAGWNRYSVVDNEIALLLARMYVTPAYRGKYTVGRKILPLIWQETTAYDTLWMTFNEHNSALQSWFTDRYIHTGLVPTLYKNFKFIGKKEVYYTMQYVYQYCRI